MMDTLLKTATHEIKTYKQDPIKKKIGIEKSWRDAELFRTDELVKLPDYPVDLLAYRIDLREYPQKIDFPNGTRPTI